jgi:malate dehydrogenase
VPDILRSYEELKTGRTAGITSAAGMKTLVTAIVDNTNEIIPSSAVLDGEYGLNKLSMGVPLVLGSGGIHEVIELELEPEEKTYLKTTLNVLQPAMRVVDDFIASSK